MSSHSRVPSASRGGPAVSVGMPAYNSAQWIADAVASILGQTFQDFELIISDNASTDDTFAICEELARADPRVRLLRNARNLGANRNYMAVLRAATGTYFKWASSNDFCAPTFIEKCVAALERDPAAVLACSRSSLFEESIESAKPYDRDVECISPQPATRFIEVLHKLALNNAFNGVIRCEALRGVAPLASHMGADIALMAELALKGKFLLIDERLFYRRMTAMSATKLKSARDVDEHLVPHTRKPLQWQYWRFHASLLRAAMSAPVGRDWFDAVGFALRAMLWSRHNLVGDIRKAMQRAAW